MTRCAEILAAGAAFACVAMWPAVGRAQDPAAKPIDTAQRVGWVTASVVSPTSLSAGVFVAGFGTAIDFPPEWHRSVEGFGRRYVSRDAAIVVSNGLEAGLGSMWRGSALLQV